MNYTETGPIYGTPLINTLPLGTGGMLQACPSRADLEQVATVNERTAAAYEVLLWHWQRLQAELKQARIDYDAAYREWSARDNRQSAEIERMERENRELRHAIADVVTNDPIVAAVVSIGEELDLSDDEEDEYEHDEEDEYAEWSTDL